MAAGHFKNMGRLWLGKWLIVEKSEWMKEKSLYSETVLQWATKTMMVGTVPCP